MPADTHIRRGEKNAVSVAQAAISRTRAYPDFLAWHQRTPLEVKDIDDFRRLPVIDKRTYIDCYELPDLVLDGVFTQAYTIEKSSGHAGGSYYWFRRPEEDEMFPSYLEYAFVQFYEMDRRSTLVLITLALGTWTSGEKMAQALREVAASRKHPLTVMAPGTNLEEILEIVNDVGPHYEQVVIVGYPPFIKTVVDEGARRGIDWKARRVRLGLGGEGYSEQWREHMAAIIGVDSHKDLLAISGGYGAADIGMTVGREYPMTVLIRKLCLEDSGLAKSLFSNSGRLGTLPGLLQYNPATCYLESIDSELVFTVLSGIPLTRYNIHDQGGVLPYAQVMETLQDHGYDVPARLERLGYGREQIWRLPFFFVFGRTDGTVSIVGANIFPDNIQAVLSEANDHDIITFKLSVEVSEEFSQRLAIALEHHADELAEEHAARLALRYRGLLVSGLRKINQDFRDAHDDNPQVADPKVTVYARGTGPFATKATIKDSYIE